MLNFSGAFLIMFSIMGVDREYFLVASAESSFLKTMPQVFGEKYLVTKKNLRLFNNTISTMAKVHNIKSSGKSEVETIKAEESKVKSTSTNPSKDSKVKNATLDGETKVGSDIRPGELNAEMAEKIKQEKEIEGWEKNKSRDPKEYIDPVSDTTIISGRNLCENPNTTIVIICLSRPTGLSIRAAIRETWASLNMSNVKVGFFIGRHRDPGVQISIQQESVQFKDMIQEDFLDSYMNLTLKSILMLKWYIKNCPKSSFLMKVDDDTFVNLELLVRRLAEHDPVGKLLGFLFETAEVTHEVKDKWYVPKYIYPNNSYPPYLNGPAYVMSRDVATKLYATALTTPLFHLEDVYITGICAREANVERQHFNLYFCSSLTCDIARPFVTLRHLFVSSHPLSPQQMRFEWRHRSAPSCGILSFMFLICLSLFTFVVLRSLFDYSRKIFSTFHNK